MNHIQEHQLQQKAKILGMFGNFKGLMDTKEAFAKSKFSDKERDKLANKDEAESDGSYPIRNESDLHNAIQAYGRSKNKGKTKAWIKKRAKELGHEDKLPDDWKKGEDDDISGADDGGIEKGMVSDALGGYGNNVITVSKTGKEVKGAFMKLKDELTSNKNKIEAEMSVLVTQIGTPPTEDNYNSYGKFEKLQGKLGEAPKRYPWTECYCNEAKSDGVYNLDVKPEASQQQVTCTLKSKYNDLVYQLCECCVDLCYIDTIEDNMKDGEKYNLTVQQAAMLGF